MTDFDDLAQRHADALRDSLRSEHPPAPPGRRARRALLPQLGAAAAAIAIAVGGYALWPEDDVPAVDPATQTSSGTELPGTQSGQLTRPDGADQAGWQFLGELPREATGRQLSTVVGQDLVVLTTRGAWVVTLQGSWEWVPTPDGVLDNCCEDGTFITVSEDQGLLLPGSGESAWLLNVNELAWEETEPPPVEPPYLGAAVLDDGSVAIVQRAARAPDREARGPLAAVWNSRTREWAMLPELPSPISNGAVATDGTSVFAAGTWQDGNNEIQGSHDAFRLDPTETAWEELPGVPISGQAPTIGWLPSTGLLSVNHEGEMAVFDGQAWESGAVTMDSGECRPVLLTTRSGAVLWCDYEVVQLTDDREWSSLGTLVGTSRATLTATSEGTVVATATVGEDQTIRIWTLAPFPRPEE